MNSAPIDRVPIEKLVYLAGTGRNGSTLIGQCLALDNRVLFPGELTHLWQRGFVDSELCSCATPFRECPFWKEPVRKFEFNHNVKTVLAQRNQTSQLSQVPLLWAGYRPRSTSIQNYVQSYSELIHLLIRESGCKIVVDSSKYPTDLAALLEHRHILPPLHIVHLVRDARAVVHSWKKRKRRTEVHWQETEMPRYSSLQTAAAWRLFNGLIPRLAKKYNTPYTLLRYEDFVLDKIGELTKLSSGIGFDWSLDIKENAISHAIGGNPSKFEFRFDAIEPDTKWETELSARDRMIVAMITKRMQRRFGYE